MIVAVPRQNDDHDKPFELSCIHVSCRTLWVMLRCLYLHSDAASMKPDLGIRYLDLRPGRIVSVPEECLADILF